VDLGADDGKFGERRVDEFLVQVRILAQGHAQDRSESEQQREGREEAVVGQERN